MIQWDQGTSSSFRHRWHGSSGLHSEQLLQTSCTAYTQVLCFQKLTVASSDKDNSPAISCMQISAQFFSCFSFLLSLSISFSGPLITWVFISELLRCTARSSCAPSFHLAPPSPMIFTYVSIVIAKVFFSRPATSPLLLCLLLDILGLKERYCTIMQLYSIKVYKSKTTHRGYMHMSMNARHVN